MLKIDILKQEL